MRSFCPSLADVELATFLMLKVGPAEPYHRAPQALFLVVVQGTSEVTASDGKVKHFDKGDVVLMDDATGKSHFAKIIGEVNHIALLIPVAN